MALLTNINGKFSVSDAGAVTFNNAFTFPTADGTANYVLKTNGSGTVSWSPDSSPTVYWAANGNDIYNTNSANVGIGTASTEGKLTIKYTSANPPTSGTAANSAIQILSNLSPPHQLNIGVVNAPSYGSYIQASDNNLAVNYALLLQPNGGNVGIGTYSPDKLLEISHDASSHDPVLRLTGTSTGGYAAGIEWQSGYGPKTSAQIFSTASGSQGGELWINVRRQATNTLERLIYLDTFGQIFFYGQMRLEVAATETNPIVGTDCAFLMKNTSNTDGNLAVIDFMNSTGFVTGRIGAQFLDAGDRDTDLMFFTRANGGGLTEKMRIDSSGRTIIQSGTLTAPAYTPAQGYPLHVQGNSNQSYISIGRAGQTTGSQGMIVGIDTTTSYLWNRDNINITFGCGDLEKLRISPSSQSLRIKGGSVTGSNYMQFVNSAGTAQGYFGYGGASNILYMVQQVDGDMQFYSNGATRMTIKTDGKVGIGTALPQSKLDLLQPDSSANTLGQSVTAALGIRMANAIGQVGQIVFNNDAAPSYGYGSIGMIMTSGTGVGLGDMIFSTKSTGVDNPSTERMRITSAGRVTINNKPNSGLGYAVLIDVGTGATGDVGYQTLSQLNTNLAGASDIRFKKNIKIIPNAIEKIKTINGYTFDWDSENEDYNYSEKEGRDAGIIAQEIQKVLPEIVQIATVDRDEEGKSTSGKNYLSVDYKKIIPLLIQGIKEQETSIQELKAEIEILKNK